MLTVGKAPLPHMYCRHILSQVGPNGTVGNRWFNMPWWLTLGAWSKKLEHSDLALGRFVELFDSVIEAIIKSKANDMPTYLPAYFKVCGLQN